jgi:hypothetical protein
MQDYVPQPIIIREVNGHVVTQDGDQASIDGRPARVTSVAEILGNKQHYMRATLKSVMPRMESGEIAAIVCERIDGKDVNILITPDQYAVGAPERARYAARRRGCGWRT